MTDQKKRFSIDVAESYQTELAALAKKHKVTQGEIVEGMLDLINTGTFGNVATLVFDGKRLDKVQARARERELLRKVRALPEGQLEKVLGATE